MRPLRNLVLVKQELIRTEEKSEGGIYLIKGDTSLYDFKRENTIDEILHKNDTGRIGLLGRLLEYNRKKNGTHYEFYRGEQDKNMASIETNEALKDLVFGRKDSSGVVQSIGDKCKYFKEGDKVIFKKNSGYHVAFGENDLIMVEENDILAKKEGNDYFVHPDCVIVKISKEARDNVFKRKVVDNAGNEVTIFLPAPSQKSDGNYTEYFVTCGEVYAVGDNVKNTQTGDIGILNYLCDNEEDIIVGYEGEDKLIVVSAVTKRHTETLIAYANRRSSRDQIVYEKDDYENMSQLLGVVRDKELIAHDPYIFLKHENTIIEKKTQSGIHYSVDEKIIKREVLAISEESHKITGIKKGDVITIDDFDVFNITLDDGVISAVNDIDVMLK